MAMNLTWQIQRANDRDSPEQVSTSPTSNAAGFRAYPSQDCAGCSPKNMEAVETWARLAPAAENSSKPDVNPGDESESDLSDIDDKLFELLCTEYESTLTHPRSQPTKPCLAKLNQASRSTLRLEITCSHKGGGRIIFKPLALLISRLSCYRPPLGLAPKPCGLPRVWADSRQALYETLPYFKKPQGGCHQNNRHVYAFLFDGTSHHREYMDEDVVIARATGGMEGDDAGNMIQGRSQSILDSNAQAILTDMQLQNPLIIICGDRHDRAHVRLPHKYCVLDWYKPITIWAEKSKGRAGAIHKTIKIRFERLAAKGTTWHVPSYQSELNYRGLSKSMALLHRKCANCDRTWPQVYLETWTCLNETCPKFWQTPDGFEVPSDRLNFNPAFLSHRSPWQYERPPYDLAPSLPDVGRVIGDNITYLNTRGIVCPKCGRCNSRYLFRKWICDNPDCDWPGLEPSHKRVVPSALHLPWESIGDGPSLARNRHADGVNVTTRYLHGYKICTYSFNGIEGCLIHAIANATIDGAPRGPDEMFEAMQMHDLRLERRRFGRQMGTMPKGSRTRKSRGSIASLEEDATEMTLLGTDDSNDGDFMVAFSANYGMPYKFIASGATQSFEDAAWPVRACRSRLNWARRMFANEGEEADFNELLVFAYMEGQKVDYHDDGEDGIGPCVASLSLGCKARMSLRVKAKHYVGCSRSGVLTQDQPPLLCLGGQEMYTKRLVAWEEMNEMVRKETSHADVKVRLRSLPKELGIYELRSKKAPDLLTITLGHGDIMIMQGDEMQKYLEHKVVPEGLLRFAMTCRDVLPEHLGEHERPTYDVLPDGYGYDGSRDVVGWTNENTDMAVDDSTMVDEEFQTKRRVSAFVDFVTL